MSGNVMLISYCLWKEWPNSSILLKWISGCEIFLVNGKDDFVHNTVRCLVIIKITYSPAD